MGLIHREGWVVGWDPSADLVKGPKQCLLRSDNLVHDEHGILGLRQGSATLNPNDNNGVPVPMNSNTSGVHSLYTVAITNKRFRCAGSDNIAYRNFNQFATLGGTGDMAFGSFQGHILVARGTTKFKNDGTTTRNWGIAKPTSAPGVGVLDPRVNVLGTFDNGETPAWVAKEGSIAGGQGQDGVNNGARAVTPATSGKGTIEKLYPTTQNFDSYDGGAATGAEEDSIEFYAWISNPDQLEILSLAIDCNPNSKAPFQDDYFYHEFSVDDAVEVKLDPKRLLRDRPDVEGIERDHFFDNTENRPAFRTRIRRDTPTANTGWTKFVILRGQMERVGSTPGCGWDTIKALQLGFKFGTDSEVQTTVGSVRFDALRMLGGSDRTFTGKFRAHVVYARTFDNYIALSEPSAESVEFECRNNGIVVSVDAATSAAKDAQVAEAGGEAWAYIGGGSMTRFYRGGVQSAQTSGSISILCVDGERSMIIANLPMETSNVVPPDNIIGPHGVVGPYFNKMIALTSTKVHISRDGNPDSFWTSLDLADPSERILWGLISGEEVLIGTTKDIYRLQGSLSELPDGSIDARLGNTGSKPPISEFIAQDGGNFVYLASDGFRVGGGSGSIPINWNLDTLLGNHISRHGVSPMNLGLAPGKFRGGMYAGRIYVLSFEGTNELASNIVYVCELNEKRWRREVYPRSFQSLYREPTGVMLAGDSSGCMWMINVDTSSRGDVFGVAGDIPIPVDYRTVSDDGDQPLTFKEWQDWRADLFVSGEDSGVELVFDEGQSTQFFLNGMTAYATVQIALGDIAAANRSKRIQTKITGNYNIFKLGGFSITYRECPVPRLYWDVFLDFNTPDQVWIREVEVKARCLVNIKARILFDGEERTLTNDGVITVRPSVESTYPLEIGRNCHGRLPRIIITPTTTDDPQYAVELYWVKVKARVAGRVTEKIFKVVGPDA